MNLTYELARRPYDGPWYWERSAHSKLDRIAVPIMNIAPQGGQTHFRGQLWGYPQIKAPKKLVVVPPTGFWSHLRYLTNRALNQHMLRWFDHWLKGIDTGIMQEPEVAIFDPGTRQWRYENEYPLKRTQWTPLFLRGGASLSLERPRRGSARPLPDAGLLCAAHRRQARAVLRDAAARTATCGSGDRRA